MKKGKIVLQNLQKETTDTKVCSLKIVCGGKPLPNNRENFYAGASACIECTTAKSKRLWAEKKNDNLFFGN